MSKSNLTTVKNVKDLPTLLPEMEKKELFNMIQESEPLALLSDKEFKILGIMPEIVEVPKGDAENGGFITVDENGDEILVERQRVTLITNIGVFHSYSVTFNKALAKALNVFGDDYAENTYIITTKLRGSGKGAKAYYVVKVV